MNTAQTLPQQRFVQVLHVVAREAGHLGYSRRRLFAEPIDAAWVRSLDDKPELAERLEAFVSRFGRMRLGDHDLPGPVATDSAIR